MKRFARTLLFFAFGLLLLAPVQAREKRPNIIFIMVDDLGNADLGYRGGKIKTPNLDALAQGGVRLESFYGMPLCTPARAALMTGRYPMRYGLQTGVIFPAHDYGLPTDERTLPEALKEAGYRTYMVGKWHLGHADHKYWPQNRGFDYFYGCLGEAVDYFKHDRGGVIDWQRNGKYLTEGGYFMNLIKTALLPTKIELFNLAEDPSEKTNVAEQYPDIVKALEASLEAYARQQKMSLWLKAQPAFLGVQGKTRIDSDYDLDSDDLPQQKLALPK